MTHGTLDFSSSSKTGFLGRGGGEGISVLSTGTAGSDCTMPERGQQVHMRSACLVALRAAHSPEPRDEDMQGAAGSRLLACWTSLFPTGRGAQASLSALPCPAVVAVARRTRTLSLQHVVGILDLCFLWQCQCPAVQQLDDLALHFLGHPVPQVLRGKRKRKNLVTAAGRQRWHAVPRANAQQVLWYTELCCHLESLLLHGGGRGWFGNLGPASHRVTRLVPGPALVLLGTGC